MLDPKRQRSPATRSHRPAAPAQALAGSSSNASGSPRVLVRNSSATRSSNRPGITDAKSDRASATAKAVEHQRRRADGSVRLGFRVAGKKNDQLPRGACAHEGQDLCGGFVEPLCVVDHAQKRPLLGHLEEQARAVARPTANEEPVGMRTLARPERDFKRTALGSGKSVKHDRAAARRADAATRTASSISDSDPRRT